MFKKEQIKYYTHCTRFWKCWPNICRFWWLENIFLSKTFEVQNFNQKRRNDTPVNHFLPENIQDNVDNFDEN